MSPSSMYDLPENLVDDILLRLPIKFLLRCLVVCKWLQSIITSTDFINLHHKRHQDLDSCVVIYHNEKIISYFSYHNGVLCLYDSKKFYFWNPAIRAYKSTSVRGNFTCSYYDDMALGFAYVPRINDFKLVRILLKPLPKKDKNRNRSGAGGVGYSYHVDVYTISLNSWRRIENHRINLSCKIHGLIIHGFSVGELVGGVFHWEAQEEESKGVILGFHMDDEVFHRIALPEGNPQNLTIWNYKDYSLYACFDTPTAFEIWVMKEYGIADSWIKLVNLSKSNDPMWFFENGQILVSSEDLQFSLCDMKTGRVKKHLQVLEYDGEEDDQSVYVRSYTESLFLLNQSRRIQKSMRTTGC